MKNQNKFKKVLLAILKYSLVVVITVILVFLCRRQLIKYGYKAYKAIEHKHIYQKRSFSKVDYPDGFSVHGIDVSRYQDDIDWKKLKTKNEYGETLQFRFAFIKATEGILLEDPMFMDNWSEATEAKVIKGAYHFFLPNRDGKLQAKNFISMVNLKKGDLPPVVDVEVTKGRSKKIIVAQLKSFCSVIEKEYGIKPVIYSSPKFIERYLASDFKTYKFWVAHYYKDELVINKNIDWLFWQHSDKAGITGCNKPVDVNVFNGKMADLQNILLR